MSDELYKSAQSEKRDGDTYITIDSIEFVKLYANFVERRRYINHLESLLYHLIQKLVHTKLPADAYCDEEIQDAISYISDEVDTVLRGDHDFSGYIDDNGEMKPGELAFSVVKLMIIVCNDEYIDFFLELKIYDPRSMVETIKGIQHVVRVADDFDFLSGFDGLDDFDEAN